MSDFYADLLNRLHEDGVYRTIQQIEIDGKYVTGEGQRMLNLSGNDYLGLASLEKNDSFPFSNYRMSSSSSRLLTGNDPVVEKFEAELAEAYSAPSALLWDSGYHANTGLIPVLCQGNTLILADKLVHASMIDGIRLSGVDFRRFRHNDTSHLHTLLERYGSDYERVWILLESVYSMDGDIAPLQEILELKNKYPNLYIYLDEAHGVGVFGHSGLGLCEELGAIQHVDVILGTLGKALASVGAFTIMSQTLRQLAISSARSFIFSTSLPPLCIAWSRHMFDVMRHRSDLRSHLRELWSIVSQELGVDASSPIIPIRIPGAHKCAEVARKLVEQGYYVRPIRRPTVPPGTERIRLSLSAAMAEEEVYSMCQTFKKILRAYEVSMEE